MRFSTASSGMSTAVVEGNQDGENGGEEVPFDRLAHFRPVLANIRLDKLPELAPRLRQGVEVSEGCLDPVLVGCIVENPENALCGSYNILFKINFDDEKTWLPKGPDVATPENFGPKAAQSMQSEVMAARFLKRNTEIPLPQYMALISHSKM